MNLNGVVEQIISSDKKIILLYAFNTVGKTRLSVAFKDVTKAANHGEHAGVYYNAYSEDLFVWDNDEENGGENPRLVLRESSLNQFHSLLTEDDVRKKSNLYNPTFDISFELYENAEQGIKAVSFCPIGEDAEKRTYIKISRAEERIFVWCFFLALFEVEGWADKQSAHFFIDDPVSSLDDHNIFITAASVLNLIEKYHGDRKIIITTHHIGFFSTIVNWLTRGGERDKYKNKTKAWILNKDESGNLTLEDVKKSVFLYHLHLLRELSIAKRENRLKSYHLVLLRQILENIASFLGTGQFSYVLRQIGIENDEDTAQIINILSHKNVFAYEGDEMVPDTRKRFDMIFDGLLDKYNFILHDGEQK